MEVKKFQLAMRPKKYLTHDFLVYQDPKIQAARSEMQAGGIVQREGFSKGSSFKLNKNTAKKLKKTLPRGVGLFYNSKTNTWTVEGNISKDGERVYRESISSPTEQQVLDFVEDYKIARKKILPNEITTGQFQKLRLSDEYVDLTDQQFADVLNKKGLKTVQQYKPFTRENVKNYQKNLGITDQVGKTASPTRPMNEVKKLIKSAPGGNIILKEFKGNESYLRKYANSIVKQQKANLAYNFPLGNTKEQIMWKNFYESSKRGDRITIGGTFNGKDLSDPANWPRDKDGRINWHLKDKDGVQAWKNMTFTDNQAPNKPKTFYWNNQQGDLKNQIDNTFGKGFFERNTRAYDQQAVDRKKTITIDGKPKNINQFIAEEMIKKDFQAIPGNEGKIPSKEYIKLKMKNYNFQEVHHLEGVGKNPYKVELASRDANRKLGLLEAQRVRGVITDEEFKKQAQAISDQYGGIRYKVGSKYVGTKGTPQTILTSIQNQFDNPEIMRAVIGSLSDDPACALPAKAEGGRIGFQKGSDLCYQQGLKKLDEAKKNPGAAAKLKGKLGTAAKGFGKVLRFLELPFEVAIEGLLVGDAMLRGQSFERAVKGNTLFMRALMPGGYSTTADEQRIKEISENNPAVKTYFDAKQRTDKYQELVNKVEQNEKIAAGLVAPEDIGLTASNLEESKKELNEFIENNYQHFDRDKEILNPEGYHAQQADQAARDYVSKEVYESGYGKGQVIARESQMEDPLADFVQPEQEFEKERLEDVQEQVDQFGFIPTEQEFMQGLNKDSMKQFIKTRYPNMDEQQLNMLTDFAIQQQYQNIRNPYAVYDFSKSVPASPFARGGRVGFSNGGGIRRRTFLKLMAGVGAALGALKSGIIKLSSPVAKKVLKDAPAGTPDWFAPLVDKIMREGVDVPNANIKTTTTRETVKKLEIPSEGAEGALTDKYYLFENPDTGEIRVDVDVPGIGANDNEFSIFMRPDRVEGINDDGTPQLSEGEFFLSEDRAAGVQSGPDDWDMELLSTDVGLDDSASDWHAVEEFATGKTNKAKQAEKLKFKKAVESDPTQDIIDRYGEYDYPGPDIDD